MRNCFLPVFLSAQYLFSALGPVNTKAQSFDNERQDNKSSEKDVELVKAAKNSAIPFESPEEPLNFVSPTIGQAIQFPRFQAIGIGRHDGRIAQLTGQS